MRPLPRPSSPPHLARSLTLSPPADHHLGGRAQPRGQEVPQVADEARPPVPLLRIQLQCVPSSSSLTNLSRATTADSFTPYALPTRRSTRCERPRSCCQGGLPRLQRLGPKAPVRPSRPSPSSRFHSADSRSNLACRYHDPKSEKDDPTWFMVDVEVRALAPSSCSSARRSSS